MTISRSVLKEHLLRLEGVPAEAFVRLRGGELAAIIRDALEGRRALEVVRARAGRAAVAAAEAAEEHARERLYLRAGHQGAVTYAAKELGVAHLLGLGFPDHLPPAWSAHHWEVLLEGEVEPLRAPDVVTAYHWLRAAWAMGELNARLVWRPR